MKHKVKHSKRVIGAPNSNKEKKIRTKHSERMDHRTSNTLN